MSAQPSALCQHRRSACESESPLAPAVGANVAQLLDEHAADLDLLPLSDRMPRPVGTVDTRTFELNPEPPPVAVFEVARTVP